MLLQAQREHLLRGDVAWARRCGDRLDVATRPQQQQARGLQQTVVGRRQEECVAGRAGASAGAAEPLQERRDGSWRVDLDDTVEVADVDAEFERRRGDDDAVPCLGERLLGAAPLVDRQRGVRDEGRDVSLSQGARELLDLASRLAEDEPLLAGVQQRDDLGRVGEGADVVERDVARRPSGAGHDVRGNDGRRAPVRPRPLQPWSSSSGLPTVADSPMRWIGWPASFSSRSSTASRCQPRSSPAKAWTSSTTTARTLAKCSRGLTFVETSIASSDSGVVSRTSGGSARIRLALALGRVAVPQLRPTPEPVGVGVETGLEVVQQCAQGADVQD